jgi:HlyD family secretion protein
VKIPETQARDIQAGLPAEVDTRNGVVAGKVSRVNPSVQDGTVLVDITFPEAELPKGARPDLSVEGTVELERIDDALIVGRPAFGQDETTISLYRLSADGDTATRTRVRLGRGSIGTIEVREGLQAGDRVILSDTSAYDASEEIGLR